MSSSDSDAPIPTRKRVPTDTAITSALRAAVQACYTNNDEENLTHKRIRATVARKLKLADDFFKTSNKWNAKSKQIVLDEIAKHDNAQDEVVKEPSPEPLPATRKPEPRTKPKSKPKPKPASKRATKKVVSDDEEEDDEDADDVDDDAEEALSPANLKKPVREPAQKKETKKPTKRKSDEAIPQRSRKRQKQVVTSDEEAASEEVDEGEKEDEDKASEEEFRKDEDIDETGDVEELQNDEQDKSRQEQPQQRASEIKAPEHDSDSEMSVVFDEPPAKKGGRKKSTSSTTNKPASKDATTTKAKSTKSESTLTPQEEEIKRLQSWLVKCGLRKVWSKELSNCDTPKEKIAHLKRLLKDVGMEGRFSEDKAKKIKEEREFRKDLEEIKEGNAKWGESEGSGKEEDGGGRPRRKLARGLRELAAFDDEEESD